MKVYRVDEHQIGKPAKFVELPDGYQVTNNDGTIRMELRHTTVMDGSMESDFYYSTMWIREGDGWIKSNSVQNYKTKEEFVSAIRDVEEFSQAIKEYDLNHNRQ